MNHTSSQVLEKKFWKEIKRNHKQSGEKVALFWLHNSSNTHWKKKFESFPIMLAVIGMESAQRPPT